MPEMPSDLLAMIDAVNRRYTKNATPEPGAELAANLCDELELAEALKADVCKVLDEKYGAVNRLLLCSVLADIAFERSLACFGEFDNNEKGWRIYWRKCIRGAIQFVADVHRKPGPWDEGGAMMTFLDYRSQVPSPLDKLTKSVYCISGKEVQEVYAPGQIKW